MAVFLHNAGANSPAPYQTLIVVHLEKHLDFRADTYDLMVKKSSVVLKLFNGSLSDKFMKTRHHCLEAHRGIPIAGHMQMAKCQHPSCDSYHDTFDAAAAAGAKF